MKTLILIFISLLLVVGCARTGTPLPGTSPQASTLPQASATPSSGPASPTATPAVGATASPVAGSAIPAVYSLDPSALKELPEGVTRVADQKGRPDQALAFTGQMTKVEVPWDINPEKHPQLTITAWARFMGKPEERGLFQVVSHDNGDYDRSLGIDTRAGEWGWSAFVGDAFVMGGVKVNPQEWVFLSVSYDQTGKLSQMTVGETVVPGKPALLGKGHPFLWIGGNPSFGEHFIGEIAHVQIFDKVLSPEELRTVQNQ